MNREKIKQLIVEHKNRFLKPTDLVARDSQPAIDKLLPSKEIIAISGVRRSGKSSLMNLIVGDIIQNKKIPENNILYLNFEDERFIDFDHHDFETLFEIFHEGVLSEKKY